MRLKRRRCDKKVKASKMIGSSSKKMGKESSNGPPFDHCQGNMAFVGLGSCDNIQTKRSIFEYTNQPKLQIQRTVCLADLFSRSVKLIHLLADSSSWFYAYCTALCSMCNVHVLQSTCVANCMCCKVHLSQIYFYKTFNS